MNRIVKYWLGVVVCCLFFQASAYGEGIRWSGFGSITGGFIDEYHTFRNSDYTEDFEFKTDSKLALQADIDLEEGLSATVQILGKGVDDFKPKLEWSYLSYNVASEFTLRAGRVRVPFYMYSDYLDVGYAQPFSIPPKAIYNVTFSTFDGLSLLYSTYLNDWDILANIIFGSVNDTFFTTTTPTDGKVDHIYGINTQVSLDWLSIYIAYFSGDVEIPHPLIEANADGLVAAGASAEAASKLRIDGDKGTFLGGGFTVDYENWIINTEFVRGDIENSFALETEQWYLLLGYRAGDFQPYIMYEELESIKNTSTASAFPGFLQASIQAGFDAQMFEYNATSLGLRYDFHSSAALKVQYTRFDDIVDLTSKFGTFDVKEDLHQLTVGVDFIF